MTAQLIVGQPAKKNARILAILMAFFIAIGSSISFAPSASADTGGYPYANYYGPGTDPSQSWWTNSSGGGYSGYGYAYRNCTDYVAWKLQSLGVADAKTRGLGNGKEWAAKAEGQNGVTVNSTPAYGAAAVQTSGAYGHVAFVESVNGNGTITVSEYNHNWPLDGNYGTRTGTASALGFVSFVHFGVSTPTPTTLPGPFVSASYSGSTKHIFTVDSNRVVRETWWDYGQQPQTGTITQLGSGTPTGISSIVAGAWRHVYITTKEGPVYETWWQPGQAAATWQIANVPNAVGVSSALVNDTKQIFTIDSSRTIRETWWGYGQQPQTASITTLSQGTPTSASSIVAGPYRHVYVTTKEGPVYETWWQPGQAAATWQIANVPNAVGVSAHLNGNLKQIFTIDTSGQLRETWWSSGQQPSTGSIATLSSDVAGLSSLIVGDYRHAYAVTRNGAVTETWWKYGIPQTTWQVAAI